LATIKEERAMATTVQTHPMISIHHDATVQDAARLMADCSISAVGVLDTDKEFAGIVTERDLAWFVATGLGSHETRIGEIVNELPVIVEGPITDTTALDHMSRSNVRHLIVREGDDHRIVSIRDLALAQRDPLLVRDVMTTPVIACRAEAFFEEVAETLADRDISGMPVLNEAGHVVGIISERDLAHALGGPMVRLSLHRHNPRSLRDVTGLPRGERRAKDIMTAPAVTVTPDTDLETTARLLRLFEINRVPVIEDGRLVGVVTRGDVLGAVAHLRHPSMDLTAPPVLVGSTGAVSRSGMLV
jgi:CBS domain-containing protein